MDSNIQKEEFSYAYIYAIAATTGCAVQRTTTPLDRLGVDLIITGINNQDIIDFPLLYVQVKCTSRQVLTANSLRYPLSVKNYEELRIRDRYPPLILIVVIVPDQVNDWLNQSEAELCLKRCAYWISLAGKAPTQNQETIIVYIPRENIFTANVLKTMMQRITAGERL
ncbi:hypothetical protein MC7420_830 [Coleofasciculus chthonoplastes PCC 7420]|uniref:DUF4365 domain-containing protein n=1 Tax=Coleofasciculus chthonoplastes PCC 7420 TaxID=118168 RepID=B4VTC6_9CYAN|nr:DUF4365 domain-containing protein [Coleofasciculus chthonoplastes]EDX74956.1 hypothetical protein MC7420_830 [Coleofasciculus chthonoplastes PCC 7420]